MGQNSPTENDFAKPQLFFIEFMLKILYAFARPHTIWGTSLSVLCMALLAENRDLPLILYSVVTALLANIYIVGLNQLTDVEIDRINKPFLPIPSGNLSYTTAEKWVWFAGLGALGLGLWQGSWLALTICVSLLIGTLYSLPPFRLKRNPISAAFCILAIRGVVAHFGFYLHFGGKFPIPTYLVGLVIFMMMFSIVIALYKDIPDVSGDDAHQIKTFATLKGQATTSLMANYLLAISYLFFGILLYTQGHSFWAIPHFLLFIFVILKNTRASTASTVYQAHYRIIWRLFYLEYLIFMLLPQTSL